MMAWQSSLPWYEFWAPMVSIWGAGVGVSVAELNSAVWTVSTLLVAVPYAIFLILFRDDRGADE